MWLDAFIILALGIGFVTGYRKGLLHSVFFLLALVLGTIIALRFSYVAARELERLISIDPTLLPIISFIIVFALVVGLVLLIATALRGVLKVIQLDIINRLAGAVLWTGIYLFLVSTLLWFAMQYGWPGQELAEESRLLAMVQPVSPAVASAAGSVVPMFEGLYQGLEQMINPPAESDTLTSPWYSL